VALSPKEEDMITLQINKASLIAGALLVASGSLSAAVSAPEPSCAQIRATIGALQPANPELLRTIALRKDCSFTSAEVYQAAYGDRPLPPQEGRAEYLKRYHHLGENHVEDD
jgi:hypothetical protein